MLFRQEKKCTCTNLKSGIQSENGMRQFLLGTYLNLTLVAFSFHFKIVCNVIPCMYVFLRRIC